MVPYRTAGAPSSHLSPRRGEGATCGSFVHTRTDFKCGEGGNKERMSMDAITIQILRNKITSLVDEMHYHFYRSGYSTIIRESRDFSCVILDRDGRLIVAPPMFFHAPVYRHLVGRILEVYGAQGAQALGAIENAVGAANASSINEAGRSSSNFMKARRIRE